MRSMVRYSNSITLLFGLMAFSFFVRADTPATQNETTIFSATILDGSCEWEWDQSILNFSIVSPQNVAIGKTLEIKPLSVLINCNMPLTPQISVSGSTPYINNDKIFLDKLSNNAVETNGVGFMLLPDNGSGVIPSLSDFYSQLNNALANSKQAIDIAPINEANKSNQQIIWVGLVGMASSEHIVSGPFSASIIFTGYVP